MPLLANFKMDNNRNQLRTLQITRQVADIQLLAAVENTKNSVRTSYWALRSAIEQIEIARRALDIAKRSYDDSCQGRDRHLAPIEMTFETRWPGRAAYLAQIGWRTASSTAPAGGTTTSHLTTIN
jgi:hypothetical protein